MSSNQERAEVLRPFNVNIHSQLRRVAPIGIRLYSSGDRKSPRGYQADLVDTTKPNKRIQVTFAKNGRIDSVISGFRGLPLSYKHGGILLSLIQLTQVADEAVAQINKEYVFNKFGDAKEVTRIFGEETPQLSDLSAQDYDAIFTIVKRIDTGEIAKNN